jgi:cytoskeletal protein RodZ
MKWPLLLALILVLALLAWFFFGRPARKDAKAAHRADTDHPSAEATSAPVEASVEAEAAETATEDMTDADTAAVVAEAESVTAAAAADAETTEAEPVAAETVTTEPAAAEEAEAAPVEAEPNAAPYPGAVLPAADGSSSDAAYDIKGSSGKKYHTTASPYYGRTKAAVYFDSEESAEAAGFVVGFKKKANA